MSKIIKRLSIILLCLGCLLQLFILIFFTHFSYKEIIYIPVRPPLTHPDSRGALIIKGSGADGKKLPNELEAHLPRQIQESLSRLKNKKRQLLTMKQANKINFYLRKISNRKKRIDFLNRKIECIKRELEFACIKMGKILRWNQLYFVISNIDLLTLEIYEFPYWLELLDKVKIKSKTKED